MTTNPVPPPAPALPTTSDPGVGWNRNIPTSQVRIILMQTKADVTVPYEGGSRTLPGVSIVVATNGARIEQSRGVYVVVKEVDPQDPPKTTVLKGVGVAIDFPDGERWITNRGSASKKCRSCSGAR